MPVDRPDSRHARRCLNVNAKTGAGLPAAIKSFVQSLVYTGLVLLAGGAMLLGKADTVLIERVRLQANDAVTPILELLSEPVNTLSSGLEQLQHWSRLKEENARLREERDRLLRWQAVAVRLDAENASLRQLLAYVPEPKATYRTARVVADPTGAFAHTLLLNAGVQAGVHKGQIVLSGEGLVGRVVGASDLAARVLLLTDMNSRVPVAVGEGRERAILAGDNSDRPKLVHVVPGSDIEPGDAVVTSGVAGGFPPGLPVGVVESVDDNRISVRPYADRSRLEYLRAVDYGTDSLQVEPPTVRNDRPAKPDGKPSVRADAR